MGSAGAATEQYHLRWNDYHSSLPKFFRDLRDAEEMLDVSIVADTKTLKAHRLVLSACSPMFKSMLNKISYSKAHPIVFLHNVKYADIEAILDFMYNGEVNVKQEDLRSFLAVAEDLRVRGLTQESRSKSDSDDLMMQPRGVPPPVRDRDLRERSRSRSPLPSPPSHIDIPHLADPILESPGSSRSLSLSDYPSPYHPGRRGGSLDIQRRSSSQEAAGGDGVSFHRLGGRDQDDPMSNVMVARTAKGWHCPECMHISTTKGNLKSHIMSGRHKLVEKNFKCRYCERSYSTRQSMQVHISTNHREERDLDFAATHGAEGGGGGGRGGPLPPGPSPRTVPMGPASTTSSSGAPPSGNDLDMLPGGGGIPGSTSSSAAAMNQPMASPPMGSGASGGSSGTSQPQPPSGSGGGGQPLFPANLQQQQQQAAATSPPSDSSNQSFNANPQPQQTSSSTPQLPPHTSHHTNIMDHLMSYQQQQQLQQQQQQQQQHLPANYDMNSANNFPNPAHIIPKTEDPSSF